MWFALGLVALVMCPLLAGYEPSGGDPDRMYRPIKSELARSLRAGEPPLWSDSFGLGVPLAAESHVAAFYPPNAVLYRLFSVAAAYRLSMFAHYLGLAAAVFAYAGCLGIKPAGRCLAAVAFTFCGFQAIHSSHEPFYHILPYMILTLIAADRLAVTGALVWAPLVALAWGAELTLGHYQIQMWTAALAVFTGGWRAVALGKPLRAVAIVAGLAWGALIASLPLTLSWNFLFGTGMNQRRRADLMHYAMPPETWVEAIAPELFRGLQRGPEFARFWQARNTTGYETCFYIGTIPLIAACVGVCARKRTGGLAAWAAVVVVSLVLATMPSWRPGWYRALLALPGLGWFRCPGRYTMPAMLGLCLWAGRGFDRTIGIKRFRAGLALALFVAIVGFDRAVVLGKGELASEYRSFGLGVRVGLGVAAWLTGLGLLWAYRARRLSPAVPIVACAFELALLYYGSTTEWNWHVRIPEDSPVLSRLLKAPAPPSVAGFLEDVPVSAGIRAFHPYLVQNLPRPHPSMAAANFRANSGDPTALRLLRRYGATHGVWAEPVAAGAGELILETHDKALDALIALPPGMTNPRLWRLVRYADPLPQARVVVRVRADESDEDFARTAAFSEGRDDVWLSRGDIAAAGFVHPARSARLISWDGSHAVVEHDGDCALVINRTFDEGWRAQAEGAPEAGVLQADGGIQAVVLKGRGETRVKLAYRPRGLSAAAIVSGISVSSAALASALAALSRRRDNRRRGKGL